MSFIRHDTTQEVAERIVKLDEIGSTQYEEFIEERLNEKKKAFHAPIQKTKLKTFTVLKKTETIRTMSNKEIKITAQRNVYAQLLMLAQENDIDLQKLFAFPLGPVPWPLATGDGMLAKTDKAVMLHKLEENVSFQSVQILKEDINILDENVLLHCLNSILLVK